MSSTARSIIGYRGDDEHLTSSEPGLDLFSTLDLSYIFEVHLPHPMGYPVSLLQATTSVHLHPVHVNEDEYLQYIP